MEVLQSMLAWLLSHEAVLAAGVVSVVDLVWALLPGTKSYGWLHALYDFVKSKFQAPPAA